MENKSMEKIIVKIKKILELSKNNPSQAEAEAAALKAQKLMAEYHISMSEVETEKNIDDITKKLVNVGSGNKWKYCLASIVAKNFRCEYFLYGRSNVVFYGYKSDTEIAAMTFDFLFKTGNKAATNYYQNKRNHALKECGYFDGKGIKNSFLIGYLDGIEECLKKQCTALMIIIPEEVKSSYSAMTSGYKRITNELSYKNNQENQKARNEGKTTGRNAIMNKSIEAVV